MTQTDYRDPKRFDAGEWSERGRRDIDCIGRMVMGLRERERTNHYNLFRYCHNDPLDLTDPMGLQGNIWWRNMTPEVYARMMSAVTREMLRNNLSAGAIGIGTAGYARSALGGLIMGHASASQADPKTFHSWQDAGRAGAGEAIPLAQASNKEQQGDIGQSTSNSRVLAVWPSASGEVRICR